MLVYRYEKPDGGGPWFYKDGTVRYPLPEDYLYIENQEKFLYGCDSLKSLYNYFSEQKVDIQNCTIKTYDIPSIKVISVGQKGQVKFLKSDIKE